MKNTLAKYDLFISHASEDKADFVQPLAETLRSFGVDVWYDQFTLQLGDSLSRSIDKGLSGSSFGLVVLSPSFLAKGWPEYELRGLIAKEIDTSKVILPIWHNLERSELLNYSPTLADKYAIKSDSMSVVQIAASIISVVRPDLMEKIKRRASFIKMEKKGKLESVDPKLIKFGPPSHDSLPFTLVSRVRLIRAALLGVHTHSMENWVDGFRGDSHPSREIRIWEHIASCFLEYCSMNQLDKDQEKTVFTILLQTSCTSAVEENDERSASLPTGAIQTLNKMWQYSVPIFDIEDDPFPLGYPATDEDILKMKNLDKEVFPFDIPDHLVFELLKQEPPEDN